MKKWSVMKDSKSQDTEKTWHQQKKKKSMLAKSRTAKYLNIWNFNGSKNCESQYIHSDHNHSKMEGVQIYRFSLSMHKLKQAVNCFISSLALLELPLQHWWLRQIKVYWRSGFINKDSLCVFVLEIPLTSTMDSSWLLGSDISTYMHVYWKLEHALHFLGMGMRIKIHFM